MLCSISIVDTRDSISPEPRTYELGTASYIVIVQLVSTINSWTAPPPNRRLKLDGLNIIKHLIRVWTNSDRHPFGKPSAGTTSISRLAKTRVCVRFVYFICRLCWHLRDLVDLVLVTAVQSWYENRCSGYWPRLKWKQ